MALAPVARADEATDAKRTADEALVSGRPLEALEGYKALYAKNPDPALLYNIGRAYQAMNDFPAAVEAFESFEAQASPELLAKVAALPALMKELRAKVSRLTITCNVSGATIRLDDRALGPTPLVEPRRVLAGKAVLEITKDGYFPHRREIQLPPAGKLDLDVHLASKQTEGILTVKSDVVGSEVRVDGKPYGMVPTEVQLTTGSHTVEIAHEGYRPAKSSVVLGPGETKLVDLSLEKERPITATWWFWTGIGVVAAGAAVTVIALTTEREPGTGNVAPGRISAGLHF
jgi:hypothetical protein